MDGGVFSTGDDAEELLTRPREIMDNATPSGASLAATGFLRLEALTGEGRYGEHARTLLRSLGSVVGKHALGFGNLLWAVAQEAEGMTEVVVTGDRPDLVSAVQSRFEPTTVLAWGERGTGPLWEGRDESGGPTVAAYVRPHDLVAWGERGDGPFVGRPHRGRCRRPGLRLPRLRLPSLGQHPGPESGRHARYP